MAGLYVILVDKDTYQAQQLIIDPHPDLYPENTIIDNKFRAIHDTNCINFWTDTGFDRYYWSTTDSEWKYVEPRKFQTFNWTTKEYETNFLDLQQVIRHQRNSLLNASDWSQLPDNGLSSEKRAEWVTYRLALRDAPSTNSSVTDFSSVVWPTEPT